MSGIRWFDGGTGARAGRLALAAFDNGEWSVEPPPVVAEGKAESLPEARAAACEAARAFAAEVLSAFGPSPDPRRDLAEALERVRSLAESIEVDGHRDQAAVALLERHGYTGRRRPYGQDGDGPLYWEPPAWVLDTDPDMPAEGEPDGQAAGAAAPKLRGAGVVVSVGVDAFSLLPVRERSEFLAERFRSVMDSVFRLGARGPEDVVVRVPESFPEWAAFAVEVVVREAEAGEALPADTCMRCGQRFTVDQPCACEEGPEA